MLKIIEKRFITNNIKFIISAIKRYFSGLAFFSKIDDKVRSLLHEYQVHDI